ncbi:pyridoxamine 5'-phosphate oxidase family protein [Denitrobaculum tricleocarpae]|uniref:Flavin-nucleotide-binding protein n=1 Tax=Denitrobaculum tricleocarpae TaxID=2591009 RepID=A0A545TYJ6_9PROT|nr:pyridoxamine 5'-phosphate oxidase family protein [Denitrobaculum tricleocarpae]TQV82295.1 flavin-nucleotide-binding protein [Denitrobaculum tricleocarpae]
MDDAEGTGETSPFHAGEQEAQERAGVRDRAERAGGMIRDHMPEQHRDFFAQLETLFVGHVDQQGRPWASLLTGESGFIASDDPTQLQIQADILEGDPLRDSLQEGMDVGLLGLEFHSRRRNRMNGKLHSLRPGAFSVKVAQSFGNCPRFIQTRHLVARTGWRSGKQTRARVIGSAQRRLIEQADTFFIATQFSEGKGEAAEGVDVSHRGGKPGFLRIDGDAQILWPDFRGNALFNTIGNILLNPRCGLLLVDFEGGDLLYMTGQTEVIWEGPEVEAFDAAERLLRFTVEELIHLEDALPVKWEFEAYSRVLEKTGSWE